MYYFSRFGLPRAPMAQILQFPVHIKIRMIMNRDNTVRALEDRERIWDIAVIGGGATGLGVAVDAATRGYSVVLFEQEDFAKGTSSRSTKLVHGGVRYLAQGDVGLVFEALRERGLLRRNAPHLVENEDFIIPCYRWWEKPFYTIGLTVYDLMAGRLGLGKSLPKKRSTVLKLIPTLKPDGLRGGVSYHDGQFDDARLAVNLAQTATDAGGMVMNYARVTGLLKGADGTVNGVRVEDRFTDRTYDVRAGAVINATGVFVDSILVMDNPEDKPMVRPSQGIHVVLDRSFLGGTSAVMIPKTDDGRVLFAVPWHGKVIVGTTDTLREHPELEPRPLEEEVNFILDTAGRYLIRKPKRSDVLSVFAGLRPLAAPKEEGKSTKEISRSHKIIVSPSKLVTITGGKWTTYRKMAEDTIDRAIRLNLLPDRHCETAHYPIHGYHEPTDFGSPLYFYGSDEQKVLAIKAERPDLGERLHPDYPYTGAEVVWAVHEEMAYTVEDVLARRLRMLLLDARAAIEMAPAAARLMAQELGRDERWQQEQVREFTRLAEGYLLK